MYAVLLWFTFYCLVGFKTEFQLSVITVRSEVELLGVSAKIKAKAWNMKGVHSLEASVCSLQQALKLKRGWDVSISNPSLSQPKWSGSAWRRSYRRNASPTRMAPTFLCRAPPSGRIPVSLTYLIDGRNKLPYKEFCRKMKWWALEVFFNFVNSKELFFAFFIKLNWLGVGFLNRTGAEIGY